MTGPEGGSRRGLGFAGKLALLLTVLVGLPLAATFGVTRFAVERSVREQIARELDVGERVWQRFQVARERELLDRVAVLAEDFGFRDAVASGDPPTMASALANAASRIGAQAGWLVDAEGRLLAELDANRSGLPEAALARMVAVARQDGFLVGVTATGERAHALALVPVFAPALVGWVALGREFGADDVEEFAAITGLRAAVMVRDGAAQQAVAGSDRPIGAAEPFALDWRPDAPAVQAPATPDGAGLASARALRVSLPGEAPVFVVVEAARAEAMAPFADLGRQVLLLSALAAVLVLAGALYAGRRVSRPVEALAGAVTRIERGEYADPVPVPVGGGDEFGRLAGALNRMQGAIAEREATIRHQAGHDRLTGLPNRDRALMLLAQACRKAISRGREGALLTLDLDDFKQINDTLGHAFGDRVLIEVAARLREAVRDHDVVARLGADEFMVMFEEIDADAALQRAELLLRALRMPLPPGEAPIVLDASVGLVAFPQAGADAEVALRRAEIAMYDAKDGRRGVVVYAAGREEQHLRQLRLVGELRHAIDRDELALVYQPKIELVDGRVEHAEALLRWQHPELGRIGPDEFVPLAERSGLIRPLTLHVLGRALAQVCDWAGQGLDLGVAVNLSAEDLLDETLPASVDGILRRHGVAPARLILEVTETAVMRDLPVALRTLHGLRQLGIRIAIDDFGTGQSSLAQLKRLPVDELKIDKSFVLSLAEGGEDELIVRSIIDLAHTLALRVVAEGVESAGGLALLRRHGCNLAQGYHLSRPLEPAALAEWVRRRADGVDATVRGVVAAH